MKNYFEFYEIEESFKVDTDQLRSIFLKNSKKYHPDFYTLDSKEKQMEVLDLSTLNNEAYKTLSDFDKRMKYLLELKGALAEEGKNQIPQDFLMEMMEINEEIMELQFDFNQDTYEQAIKNMESIEHRNYAAVSDVIENYTADASEEDLKKIKDYYLKKRYLLRIKENLDKFATL